MALPNSSPLRFGLFEFDPRSGELRKRGMNVRLTPQARALLCILVEAPNKTRSREEIQRLLWPGNTFVDFEHGMNKVVHSLRKALGESASNPRFIETVAAEGYRFLSNELQQEPATIQQRPPCGVERVVVLPLRTDGDAGMAAMGKIVTWHLTERLAAIPAMRVIAESTVKQHKLENVHPREAGECLGAGAVLVGELTQQNGGLILQLELIDVLDGARLGGAMLERACQAGVRCERELAVEAFRRIRPCLHLVRASRKPVQQLPLSDCFEKVS